MKKKKNTVSRVHPKTLGHFGVHLRRVHLRPSQPPTATATRKYSVLYRRAFLLSVLPGGFTVEGMLGVVASPPAPPPLWLTIASSAFAWPSRVESSQKSRAQVSHKSSMSPSSKPPCTMFHLIGRSIDSFCYSELDRRRSIPDLRAVLVRMPQPTLHAESNRRSKRQRQPRPRKRAKRNR